MSQPELTNPTSSETTPPPETTTTTTASSTASSTQINDSSTASPRTTILKEEHDSNDVYNEKAHNDGDISLNIKNISEGDVRSYKHICDKILFEVNLLVERKNDEKKHTKDEGSIIVKKEEDNNGENSNSMDVEKNASDTTSCCEDEVILVKKSLILQHIIEAGLNTHDSTIESIIKENKNISTREEQQISLLLFEKIMSKHDKISLAFQLLSTSTKNQDDDSPSACKRQKLSHEDFFSDSPTASTGMFDFADENRKRENTKLNETEIRRLLKCILISLISIIKQSNITIIADDVPQKVTQLVNSLIAYKSNIHNEKNGSNDYHESYFSLELFRKWYESDHDIGPIIDLLEYNAWKSSEDNPEMVKEEQANTTKQTESHPMDQKPQIDTQAKMEDVHQIDLKPQMNAQTEDIHSIDRKEDAQAKMEDISQLEPMKEEAEDMLVALSPKSSFPPIVNTVTDENNLNSGNKSSPLQISPQNSKEPHTNPQSMKPTLTSPSKTATHHTSE